MTANNKCDHVTVSRQWDTDENFIDKWMCARCGAEFFHFALDAQPGKVAFMPSPEPQPTLRDHFAMAALTGIVAGLNLNLGRLEDGGTARLAYTLADEMLKARSA